MHESHLVQSAVKAIAEAAEAGAPRKPVKAVLGLSPDSHMDEIGLRLHLEELLAGTAAEGIAFEVRADPARIYCRACDAEFDRKPGTFHCPACGGEGRPAKPGGGLRVIGVEFAG
jgi:hydrogenase nickel incorporation protein HypA/HybF